MKQLTGSDELSLEAWQHDVYSVREQFGDAFPEPFRRSGWSWFPFPVDHITGA
jgi:hypothetical protein